MVFFNLLGRGKKIFLGDFGGVKKNFLGGNNFLGMGKKKIFGGE